MHNAKAILTTRRAGGLFVLQSSVFRINEKLLNGEQGPALTKKVGTYHHCADLFLSLYIQLKSQKTSRQMDHECCDPRDHTLTDHYQDCPFAS